MRSCTEATLGSRKAARSEMQMKKLGPRILSILHPPLEIQPNPTFPACWPTSITPCSTHCTQTRGSPAAIVNNSNDAIKNLTQPSDVSSITSAIIKSSIRLPITSETLKPTKIKILMIITKQYPQIMRQSFRNSRFVSSRCLCCLISCLIYLPLFHGSYNTQVLQQSTKFKSFRHHLYLLMYRNVVWVG